MQQVKTNILESLHILTVLGVKMEQKLNVRHQPVVNMVSLMCIVDLFSNMCLIFSSLLN